MEALLSYYPQRYLLRANPGDIVIVPDQVPQDFLEYAKKLKKLPHESRWLVVTGRNRGRYCAATALLANRAALRRLKSLLTKNHVFTPYMQTAKALALAQKLGVKCAGSSPEALKAGLAAAVNNKHLFKQTCRALGVPVLPDYLCACRESLSRAISRMGEGGRRVIVKKTVSGGGYGNLSGTANELLSRLHVWHQDGQALVEPHLGDETVVGSLVEMNEGSCHFIGLDRQLCEDDAWRGCRYPYAGRGAALIKKHSLALARHFRAQGLRGQLNLDWFDTNRGIFAIECNFRDNGFGYTLELARDIFGLAPRKAAIRYWAALKLNKKSRSLQPVLKNIGKLPSGRHCGAVLCGKPRAGKTDLLLAARDKKELARLERAALKELA